jgi:L-rhamnose mutarotase
MSPNQLRKAVYTHQLKLAKMPAAKPTLVSVSSSVPKMGVFGVEILDWVVRKMVLHHGVNRDSPLCGMDNGSSRREKEILYQVLAQMKDGIQTNSPDNALDWEAEKLFLITLPKLVEMRVARTRTATYGSGGQMPDAFSITMYSIVKKPLRKISNHFLGNVKFKEEETTLRTLTVEILQTWQYSVIEIYRSGSRESNSGARITETFFMSVDLKNELCAMFTSIFRHCPINPPCFALVTPARLLR